MDEKLIFLDIETTGLNPRRHPLMQLAAIAVDQTLAPLEAIELKIRFREQDATRASLRKNHYSRGLWAQKALAPRDAALAFAEFLRRHATSYQLDRHGERYQLAQLVAHNATFDGPFLQAWYEKHGLFLPARYQVLCMLQRAQWYFTERQDLRRPANYQLATLCQYFGVPFHAASAHDALGDVSATVGLYRALVGRSHQTQRTAA